MRAVPLEVPSPEALQELMGSAYPVSPQQWAAVSAPLEPGVVIAGAGSGKTTLMAARVVYLIATGQVAPDQVLGLTFTSKAAQELATRVRTALLDSGLLPTPGERGAPGEEVGFGEPDGGGEVGEPTMATYNAYAASMLREQGLRIGFEPDTRVLADASRYQLAAQVVARYTGTVRELTDHPETAAQDLLTLDSSMSEHLVSPGEVLAHDAEVRPRFEAARLAEVAGKNRKGHLGEIDKALGVLVRRADLIGLIEAYRRAKRDHGLMDFSEQIELAARLATEHPDVGREERARFKIVLLDEYQDTSVAQARFLAALFSGPPGDGLGHAVTAVGDPNQAIYGWRGASVHNILRFAESFPADGGVTTYNLTVSRRSKPVILDVASALATPLYAELPDVGPLEAAPGSSGGVVEVEVYESQSAELADLAERVRAAHDSTPDSAWSDIGVLTRDNVTAALVFDALSDREIPVEIVGLAGLLRLPEVAEVLATLRLLHDVTANAAMLTLLTGPRWAIGPRDLALLGRRSRELAGTGEPEVASGELREELARAVTGSDPTDVASLSDALEDPGDPGGPGEGADYSPQARWRFAALAAELRYLRSYVGEPLLDLVRRIIDATGIDVELASSLSPAAAARRDNLDLFVKAVAEFQAVDGTVTLPALLAYLSAEDELGNGLDVATPSEADSVKLLTMHRAKGLEWRSVFLVGICEGKLPYGSGRSLWCTSPKVLPVALRGDAADLPDLQGWDKEALADYRVRANAHDRDEELRLAYVALTRAAERLRITSFLWNERATPHGPSDYQRQIRDHLVAAGLPVGPWSDRPERGTPHPAADASLEVPWPCDHLSAEATRRVQAASMVVAAHEALTQGGLLEETDDLTVLATIAEWDSELDRLIAEAQRARPDDLAVPLPPALSATSVARLRDDPEQFALDLARPMPRRPVAAARFGTRFHAWVESRFGQQEMLDPDDLPGRADTEIESEAELRDLASRFDSGPFADRVPVAVEPGFSLVLGGQVIKGRIDAVYAEGDDGFLIVDWKTNRTQSADPLQLAIYRLAWAELRGVDPAKVAAAFHYVRTGETVIPDELPGRTELEALVAMQQAPDIGA